VYSETRASSKALSRDFWDSVLLLKDFPRDFWDSVLLLKAFPTDLWDSVLLLAGKPKEFLLQCTVHILRNLKILG
jgi:hypothetical protein